MWNWASHGVEPGVPEGEWMMHIKAKCVCGAEFDADVSNSISKDIAYAKEIYTLWWTQHKDCLKFSKSYMFVEKPTESQPHKERDVPPFSQDDKNQYDALVKLRPSLPVKEGLIQIPFHWLDLLMLWASWLNAAFEEIDNEE